MNRRLAQLLCGLLFIGQAMPASLAAAQPELNFKIYSPDGGSAPQADAAGAAASNADSQPQSSAPAGGALTPKTDDSINAAENKPEAKSESSAEAKPASDSMWSTDSQGSNSSLTSPSTQTPVTTSAAEQAADKTTGSQAASTTAEPEQKSKTLQGYIRVVPSGTKIPIIMDTAVDSDTSQEGDEFSARTGEDLNIDGSTVVPAGSIIKGRIAQLNAPKNMGRCGSVALKFDTVTTPDNRQIPLVANLVAHGGVVHARRGMKDIAMDTAAFSLPTLLGVGIGVLAGSSSSSSSSSSGSHINKAEGAVIGAGIGAAIGIAVLLIKKGKRVDVRPGDELKIELADDLRIPM